MDHSSSILSAFCFTLLTIYLLCICVSGRKAENTKARKGHLLFCFSMFTSPDEDTKITVFRGGKRGKQTKIQKRGKVNFSVVSCFGSRQAKTQIQIEDVNTMWEICVVWRPDVMFLSRQAERQNTTNCPHCLCLETTQHGTHQPT